MPDVTTIHRPERGSARRRSGGPDSVPCWKDWRWQLSNRIRRLSDLRDIIGGPPDVAGLEEACAGFPMAITPFYASLIRRCDDSDPIFRMAVPQIAELNHPSFLKDDPLEEDEDMPVPGLIRRYPDRALLIATTMCSVYCRHCTRKRAAGVRETALSAAGLQRVKEYLAAHPEIRDVIVSGGDPFTMSTAALERVLTAIRSVPSVEIVRIGTRTPVTLPMRVTDELTAMLRRHRPIWVNTHFNHPNEVSPEAAEACGRLVEAGIPVSNQTVLLAGVNADPSTIETLCRALVRILVRPYYLFQCDLVRGAEHFRTPLSRGIEIMEYLRGRVSGLAIPTFVVDAPHGGGKIPILPNYIVSMSPTHTVLRNFEGMLVSYPEPADPAAARSPGDGESAPGVWDLASGRASRIQPGATARQQRRGRGKRRTGGASARS
ncbi:MAG: KamA family radical SAM protein [Candidatus Eisenbacteria bacterium]